MSDELKYCFEVMGIKTDVSFSKKDDDVELTVKSIMGKNTQKFPRATLKAELEKIAGWL